MLRKGGTATIIGMIPEGQKIELPGSDFLDEKKIQGSNMGSNRFRVDMPRYVDLYLQRPAEARRARLARASASTRSTRASRPCAAARSRAASSRLNDGAESRQESLSRLDGRATVLAVKRWGPDAGSKACRRAGRRWRW